MGSGLLLGPNIFKKLVDVEISHVVTVSVIGLSITVNNVILYTLNMPFKCWNIGPEFHGLKKTYLGLFHQDFSSKF